MNNSTKDRLLEDLQNRQQASEKSRRNYPINWFLMTPLLFAPTLPLIRIGLRHNPRMMKIVWNGTVSVAFLHGTAIILGFYPKIEGITTMSPSNQ